MRAEVHQLLQGCVDRVGGAFVDCLGGLATPLRKVLEERAVTESSADRRRLLAGLKERVSADWDRVAVVFDAEFRRLGALRAGWQRDDRQANLSASALELVDDEQVEWDLAMAGALSRMKAAAGAALSEFEQRVAGALATSGDAQDVRNPASLDVAAQALKLGLEGFLANPAERRALLVYLEPLLSQAMAALFAAAAQYLAAQGVEIPRARPVVAASRGAGGAAGGAGAVGGGSAGPLPSAAGGGVDVSTDVFNMLQRLLQVTSVPTGAVGVGGGFGGGGFGGGGGTGAGAVGGGGALPTGGYAGTGGVGGGLPGSPGGTLLAVPAAMLESLERLQAFDLQVLQAGPALPPAALPASGGSVLRELRQQDFARQLSPIEAATIDIVAMLFDFIFDDRLVPDKIKALVGRLQIPLLKVAIVDKSFFSNREHPARALLDAISKVSIAAGPQLDHGHPVFEQIKSAINRILLDCDKDPDVFATQLAAIRSVLADQDDRNSELAERSKQVAERQELDDIADAKADEAFRRVLTENIGEAVPAVIRDFLAKYWTQVLKFAYVKGGIDGHPWSLAIQTLNDLLWSLTPKKEAEERQRLVTMLPELLRRVNAYLDRVGVTAEDKVPFLDALVGIHSTVIKGVPRPHRSKSRRSKSHAGKEATPAHGVAAAPSTPQPAPPDLTPPPSAVVSEDLGPAVVVSRTIQEGGIEVESLALAGKVLSSRPSRLSELDNLARGDWVEFTQEDASVVRGRLSWISPQRGILLFTNPQSAKAISVSPEALALQMRRGLAKKLFDAAEPLVDRALGRAMNSLKSA